MSSNFSEKELTRIFVNPFYAITIHPSLSMKHPYLVSEAKWIKANTMTIKEMGAKKWLENLLDVLKRGN